MNPSPNAPSSAAPVLRGVVIHPLPHALVRPGKAAFAAVPGAHPAPPAQSAPAAPAPNPIHEAAIAEARQAGYAAGLAAGEKQADEKLQRDVDEARVAAVEEARIEGLRRGLQEAEAQLVEQRLNARQEAEAQLRERTERLERLIEAAGADVARWMSNAEDDLVSLSHEAVCRVLGSYAAEPAALRGIVKHLIAQHGQRAELAVHVHPDDAEALKAEQLGRATEAAWRWVPDNAVELGGVMLRSPEGSLDARLETQLAAMREALLAVRSDRKAKARLELRGTHPATGEGT